MMKSLEDSSPKCLICGKEVGLGRVYCCNPHCQSAYERRLAILHNSAQFKLYVWIVYSSEYEAMLRGDIER